MKKMLSVRLAAMMFLQFFIWGVWWVPMSVYLGTERIGMEGLIFFAFLSQPIAAMISPFFLGFVADRYFPSEKVLGSLHLLGGALLLAAPFFAEAGGTFGRVAFLSLVILHMLCYMPTIGLTNTIAFKTMEDPEKQFPIIRVFGTFGWIVSGLFIGIVLNRFMNTAAEQSVWPFLIGGMAALVFGIYSFTLPHTPPPLKGRRTTMKEVLGLDAASRLSSRSFWVFIIGSTVISIPLAMYYTYGTLFAEDANVGREVFGQYIGESAWMSTGQMTEVLFMLLMPLAFRTMGIKWMLLAGMGAWVLRYLLFSFGAPDQIFWMIFTGILLHGVCYDFFFVTGMVYVEKKAPAEIRAQAQGFLVQMTLGLGMFIGMILGGLFLFNNIVGGTEGQERMDAYQQFWLIPAIFAAAVMVVFFLFFRERPEIDRDR